MGLREDGIIKNMVPLKKVLRWVVERREGTPIRFILDFLQYSKARRVLRGSANKFGWKRLAVSTISAIRRGKSSDTLYILGSGSSINSLGDEEWQEIRRHVSVGINHWTLHNFVPDIYAVEAVPDGRREEGASTSALEFDHLNHLQLLNRKEVLESNAIILCLAPRTHGENSQLAEMPEEMKARAFVYYRFTPSTRDAMNIRRDFSRGLRLSKSAGLDVVVPDSGATLLRLLGIALVSGFRRVILVGIDLSTTYFWQEDTAFLVNARFRDFSQPMRGPVHETMLANNRPFSVLSCVAAFHEIYAIAGAEILAIKCHPQLSDQN